MTPYKEYPWGWIGHYSELNQWYAYHTETKETTDPYTTLLEAEVALVDIECGWRCEQVYIDAQASGYHMGWHDCLHGNEFKPF